MQTKSLVLAIALSLVSVASAATMEKRGWVWKEPTIADAIDRDSNRGVMNAMHQVEEFLMASCIQTEKLNKVVGKCDPDYSKGWHSVRSCDNAGGNYFYCQTKEGEACFRISNAPENYKNGECFN